MTDTVKDTVLVVDDDRRWRDLLLEIIEEIAPEIKVRCEATKEAALQAITELGSSKLKLVVSNLRLHGSIDTPGSGIEIAKAAQQAGIPAAILTITRDEIPPIAGFAIWNKIDDSIEEGLKRALAG